MTATIHRLPVRPTLRPLDFRSPLPTATRDHYGREMLAIATKLQEAVSSIESAAASADRETALRRGAEALEASLFHTLTILGCSHDDIDIRRLLAAREAARTRRNDG